MPTNFINRGEVLTLMAMGNREGGKPYRERGFNGVAVVDAAQGESFTFQVRGVFEFALEDVKVGALIYIDYDNNLLLEKGNTELFGRAVTSSDEDGNFHCMILQSEPEFA